MSGPRQSTPPSQHACLLVLLLVVVVVLSLWHQPWPPAADATAWASRSVLSRWNGPHTHPPFACPALPAPPLPRRVLSAEVHGLQPAAHDKSLYPSDHAAVKATIQLARKLPVELQQEGQQQEAAGAGAASSSL